MMAKNEVATTDDKKAVDPWDTSDLSPEGSAEAQKLIAAIRARPNRPLASFKRRDDDGGRLLHLGDGSEKSGKLNSIRVYGVTGSGSNQFVGETLRQIYTVLKLSDDDEDAATKVGAALALMGGIDPQDELEATMALQMVAANETALRFLGRAANAEHVESASAFTNMGTKAMRAFALHAEALAKLRRNGEQVVKHVHVNEGGQAVIAGTFNHGGGGDNDKVS